MRERERERERASERERERQTDRQRQTQTEGMRVYILEALTQKLKSLGQRETIQNKTVCVEND